MLYNSSNKAWKTLKNKNLKKKVNVYKKAQAFALWEMNEKKKWREKKRDFSRLRWTYANVSWKVSLEQKPHSKQFLVHKIWL